jgi:hypothetical protein
MEHSAIAQKLRLRCSGYSNQFGCVQSLRDRETGLWRLVLSATFMFAIVQLVAPLLPQAPLENLVAPIRLLTAMAFGIVTYASCLYVLRTISARPVGSESWRLGIVQPMKLWSWFRGAVASSR